jgi:hypothetical protein
MGKPDQLGKEIFTEETPTATEGAFSFEVPAELAVFEVRLDGLLMVRNRQRQSLLPAPWSLAQAGAPTLLDLKMQRDHLDIGAVELLLHRRQSWQAAQLRKDSTYVLQPGAWMVTSHVPDWAISPSSPWRWKRVAAGCYTLGPSWFPLLWVASNELPLHPALIPFLVTRRGRPLVDFYRWSLEHRPVAWVMRMLQYVPMTQSQRDEFYRDFPPTDDPEILENRRQAEEFLSQLMQRLLKVRDDAFEKARREGEQLGLDEGKKLGIDEGKKLGIDEGKKLGIDEGKAVEAQRFVLRVLDRRGLEVSAEQRARVEACRDLALLERWLDQAILAASTDEALK